MSASPDPGVNAMTDRFHQVCAQILRALYTADPEWAAKLGEHSQAGRLTEQSEQARADRAAVLTDAMGALDDIDDTMLPTAEGVDLEMLRAKLSADLWHLTELRPHSWNPLVTLPADPLYQLVVKEDRPPAERLEDLASRCAAVPDSLRRARDGLDHDLPRVHVETAAERARGAAELLGASVDALLEEAPALRGEVEAARGPAAAALHEHARWLNSRLDDATADPRLAEREYAALLWYTLDTPISPDALLTRAESDLLAVEEEIAETAAEYEARPREAGQVRRVLDRLAERGATDAHSILACCERHLRRLSERTAELDLVGLPEGEIRIIDMPESQRGVSAAYCDAPGPLGSRPGRGAPTFIAVAPPPGHWTAERVASFYREYNTTMLRTLMAHESVPGHALQLAHSRRYDAPTDVRAVLANGPFVEGWAVYAEEMLAEAGWGDSREEDLALKLMQLKMRLRVTLNAVLDVRTHTRDIEGEEAVALLTERGHQEAGEAAAKWRRARLTSAQLSTYYVGHSEVRAVARDLAAARPEETARRRHDAMLAHGSPPPRHLRTLLGI